LSAIRHFGVGAGAVAACMLSAAAYAQDCRLVAIGTATVRAATEAGIVLEDGRTVRLAGLDLPNPAQAAPPAGTALVLKRLGTAPQTDRYGRLVAHVFISENNTERWFQADTVRRGLARVGDPACARALLAEEQAARAAKLGLWAEPVYVINKAEDHAEVLKQRGRFALVEGTVLSVRESGGTIYVNFGRRWSEDFTGHDRQAQRARFLGRGSRAEDTGRQARARPRMDRRAGWPLGGGGAS
jgi:endonuclease YncB( thermonuclease family)